MTEEMKSQLDYFKDEPKYLRKVINELEQENKELKKKNETLDKLTGIFSHRLLEKYKKALEEIREIAEDRVDDLTRTFNEIRKDVYNI